MNIIEEIKELFHPNPYTDIEENLNGEILHYSRSVVKCKYILIVSEVDKTTDLKNILRSRKEKLRNHYNATILTGVGFIEIFIGDYNDWKDKINDIKPDWHGLQSVIFQGLLFIDPKAKKHELRQSHWGPIKFGNFQGQIDKIHYLLGKMEA